MGEISLTTWIQATFVLLVVAMMGGVIGYAFGAGRSCRNAKLKGENTLLRHALDRAKRINASGVLLSVADINKKGYDAGSWLDGESYGFDRCREGVTLLIDEVLASCADAPE